ncbi:MAG TPA: hypothetical protein VGR56_02680 [Nitrososphaerales archaeon]|nr:hypothetical protein [Nitrososphaerales archaeon]
MSQLKSSFSSVLSSAISEQGMILGRTATGQKTSVAMFPRPTRRNDKSFLFDALALRQQMQRRYSDQQALLYLVVKQATLRDIGVYAGLEPFFGSMNQVGLGIFAFGPDSVVYYPLRPSGFIAMMGGESSTSSHYYDDRSFTTNTLAEASLGRIGQVRYV